MNRFRCQRILLSAMWLCALASPAAWAGPRLAFEPDKIDFGAVASGPQLKGMFILKNLGDEPLRIFGIEASCGCMASANTEFTIAPKGQAKFGFTLDTRSLKDATVKIKTNDPARPQVTLPVYATILTQVQLVNDEINFGVTLRGQTRTASTSLWQTDPRKPVHILSLTSSLANVKLAWEKKVASERVGFKITATLDSANMPEGRFGGWVQVRLDLPDNPVVKIGLAGKIVSGVVLAPNPLSIRVRHSALPLRRPRIVRLRSASGEKFRILDVKSSEPFIQATADNGKPATKHAVALNLTKGTPRTRGSSRATVKIYTDAHKAPLELRVYLSVR